MRETSPVRRRLTLGVFTAFVLLALLAGGVVMGIYVGSANLTPSEIVHALLGLPDVDILTHHIVVDRRLPRVLAAILAGAGLSVAGAVLQSLTGNALADPYILGISGGALMGAVAVIATGVTFATVTGFSTITIAAFIGGIVALLLVFALSVTRTGTLEPSRMILAGVAVGQLTGAASSAVVYFADRDAAMRVQHWTLGSLASASWTSLPTTALTVGILALVVLRYSRTLDAFAFGEEMAGHLGVNVTAMRWILYSVVSLATAALVAQAGLIGFVGLVVPHVVRMLLGPLHGTLIPFTLLTGAVLLLWTDIVCRGVLDNRELPLGLATALIGVPVFIYVLHRQRKAA